MTRSRLTLGQLGRLAGLARSSLLHYETLGLLSPEGRSPAGYRLYGEAEVGRLRAIRRLRDAGLPLATIRDLLRPNKSAGTKELAQPARLLEDRLLSICGEVENLRRQQKLLARLLATPEFRTDSPCGKKENWVALLRRAGFTEDDMRQWHIDFETDSPSGHACFLRALGMAPAEVATIRRLSKARR